MLVGDKRCVFLAGLYRAERGIAEPAARRTAARGARRSVSGPNYSGIPALRMARAKCSIAASGWPSRTRAQPL
jgi:hypothetical protein